MTRPLTSRQRFALWAVSRGQLVIRWRPNWRWQRGRPVVPLYWAVDSDVTEQIRSLRKRRLVTLRFDPLRVEITAAGLLELTRQEVAA